MSMDKQVQAGRRTRNPGTRLAGVTRSDLRCRGGGGVNRPRPQAASLLETRMHTAGRYARPRVSRSAPGGTLPTDTASSGAGRDDVTVHAAVRLTALYCASALPPLARSRHLDTPGSPGLRQPRTGL